MPKKQKSKKTSKMQVVRNVGTVASTAATALRVATMVARMVNSEVKYIETTSTGTSVTNLGTLVQLHTITQGDGASDRDGMSVKPAHLTMRYSAQVSSAATATRLRVIVFRGKQENGSVPTVANFLQVVNPNSPKNWSNKFHYKTLYDRTHVLSSTGNQEIVGKINQKQFGHINFQQGSANTENGGYYLLLLTDEATNAPSVKYHARLTFYDN